MLSPLFVTLSLAGLPCNTTGGTTLERFGVLRLFGGVSPCTVIETDQGELFAPDDLGELAVGDRVWVRGEVDPIHAQPCGEVAVPLLLDSDIQPAFAGIGRLVLRDPTHPLLETPEGERYELLTPAPFAAGSRLFVEGKVEPAPADSPAALAIDNTATGPGFASFGRLRFQGGAWLLESESDELFQLDRVGLAYANDGDYVFVEGWRDSSAREGPAPPKVRDNTTQLAIAFGGTLLDVGGLSLFEADGKLFDDDYLVQVPHPFGVGDRVFVRGRGLDDYDPLEPKIDRLIRGARVGAEFAGCGELIETGGAAFFAGEDGALIELEYVGGPLTPGQAIYVAGELDESQPTPTFEHNSIADCWELSGELVLGFECLPYFLTDENAGGFLNLFMLENLGGHWIGDQFCVRGATVAGCGTGCPVPCLVANTIIDCTR